MCFIILVALDRDSSIGPENDIAVVFNDQMCAT